MQDLSHGVTVLPFELKIGPLSLTGFGIAMLLAFVIGQIVATSELERRKQTAAANLMGDVVVAAVIGGLLGAKIYYAILFHSVSALFERAGFVFWGGLIGGIAATFGLILYKKIPFSRISDACAIGLAAAYAVGRTGCWAVGDDYGGPWDSRFAVKFPQGAPASTVQNLIDMFGVKSLAGRSPLEVIAVYPTQLFEVVMGLVMFAALWRLRDHKHAEGWLFGAYCVMAGAERFIVEFFRAKDDRFFGVLTMAQVIAIVFMALGFAWMQYKKTSRAGAPGIYPVTA
jgi:phosphatidylglycerol:prolipoprotein diacylglycerol transferase